MSETAPAGWQPDPHRRYAQRYWDGSAWTENVVDEAGAPHTDPLSTTGEGAVSPVAIGLSLLGVVLLVLSLFVLNWYSVSARDKQFAEESPGSVRLQLGIDADDLIDGLTRSEVKDIYDKIEEDPNQITAGAHHYLAWGWLASLVAAGVAVLALFAPQLRKVAIVGVLVFAVWQAWIVYGESGPRSNGDIAIGAWLGVIGLVLTAVALLLPRRREVAT